MPLDRTLRKVKVVEFMFCVFYHNNKHVTLNPRSQDQRSEIDSRQKHPQNASGHH